MKTQTVKSTIWIVQLATIDMRTSELITAPQTTPYKIARQLVAAARKSYVEQDVQRAVEQMVDRFAAQLRQAASEELKRTAMREITPPNKAQ